ncbi:MAG: TOBE domain-containing protein, partial [Methanomicrobium sp.]|nr:TOBE domain-containing protein [Methanomicrobium sp.]
AITDLRGPVIAGIRAEEIIFSRDKTNTTARNTLLGVITDIQWNGAMSRVIVDTGVLITGVVTQRNIEHLSLSCGQEIYVLFKAPAVHVFPA